MKFILSLLLILFTSPAFAYQDAGQVLNQVYGTVSSSCLTDSDADLFSTTVDSDSASGQKVLKMTATTDVVAGDVLVANPGGAREEACIVDSVSAGDSATCLSNLTYTHTAVQADVVELTNRIPRTGTTGLSTSARYIVYCRSAAGAGLACKCLAGGVSVDAGYAATGYSGGQTLYAGEKFITQFKDANIFISCVPYADNAIIDVCKIQ
jgi:hypothetical protein